MSEIVIREEQPDSPAAHLLIRRLDDDLVQNYSVTVIFGLKPTDLAPGQMVFLIAWEGETPAGCGALRFLDSGRAEIKRMYVDHPFRGRGIGKAILRELEERAARADINLLLLETRAEQEAACRMYQSAGWSAIPCYGEYAANPDSICFEKRLGAVKFVD